MTTSHLHQRSRRNLRIMAHSLVLKRGLTLPEHPSVAQIVRAVEALTGKPIDPDEEQLYLALNGFVDAAPKLAERPNPMSTFRPLTGYAAGLDLHRELAEMVR